VKSDNRGLLIALVVLVAFALSGPMVGGTLFGPGRMWEDTDRAAGWALGLLAGFVGLSMLAGPAALIVGIILVVRWLGGSSTGPDRETQGKVMEMRDPAQEALRQRFAAGEVSQEEYKKMRQALEW
jgi:uncharacterized membrane protein